MMLLSTRAAIAAMVAAGVSAGGGLMVAADAGADGAIDRSDWAVQSVVIAPVERAFEASRRAFGEPSLTEGRPATEREGGSDWRQRKGRTGEGGAPRGG